MPSITLNINDLVKLSQSPAFSADNLKRHARKLMQKYAKVAYSSTIDAFSNERDPITEQPWAPRCPAYIKHLMRIGRGNSKILQSCPRTRGGDPANAIIIHEYLKSLIESFGVYSFTPWGGGF